MTWMQKKHICKTDKIPFNSLHSSAEWYFVCFVKALLLHPCKNYSQFYALLGNPKFYSAIAMAMSIYGTLCVLVPEKFTPRDGHCFWQYFRNPKSYFGNQVSKIRFQESYFRNQILEIMVITSLLEMSSAKQIQEPLLTATFHFLSPPIS